MEKQMPVFLKEMLELDYGKEITKQIQEKYGIEKPVTFRVNLLKGSGEEIKQELQKEKIAYQQVDWYEDAFILEQVREEQIQKLKVYQEGKIYLQSLSSMIPPIFLKPKPNENILDMTAAPGGKTTQMAALSGNEAMITACEKNLVRLERLRYNLEKQGATRVNTIKQDARTLDDFLKFDKILLDAPCSGSGTNEVYEKALTKDMMKKFVQTQKELLKKAIKLVAKGGEIVYSTCSILKRENEEVLEEALRTKEIEIVPIFLEKAKTVSYLPTTIQGTICILPSDTYEGFFIAKMRKIR